MASDGSLNDHERDNLLTEIIRTQIPRERTMRFILDMRVLDRIDWDRVIPPPGRNLGQCKTAMDEMVQLFRQEAHQFPPRLETTQTLPGVSSLTSMNPVEAPRHTPTYQYNEPYMGYPPPPTHPPMGFPQVPPQHHRTLLPRPSPMSPSSAEQTRRPQPSPSSERPEIQAPKRGRPSKATVQAREKENEEATKAGREPPWARSTKRTKSSRPSDERVETPQSATTPGRDVPGGALMGTVAQGDSPTYTASAGGGKRRRLTEPPEKLVATMAATETETTGLSATQSPALTSATQGSEAAPAITATSVPASAPSNTMAASALPPVSMVPPSAHPPTTTIPASTIAPIADPSLPAPYSSTPATRPPGEPSSGT